MDQQSLIGAFTNLSAVAQFLAFVAPLITALTYFVHHRCSWQRRYLRAVHKLANLRQYLELRREAFRVLDVPNQMRHEELEKRIACDIKLDLRLQAVSLSSYHRPSDHVFIRQAIRQLSGSVFASFADDLLQRLLLLLDIQVDRENLRRNLRFTTDQQIALRRIEILRQRERDDRELIGQHIRLMQQYLTGTLEIDIYPEPASDMLRSLLNEKYNSYVALMQQDEHALAREQQN